MSVKAWEKYQPNASSPSPQYPYGSLRQETALGMGGIDDVVTHQMNCKHQNKQSPFTGAFRFAVLHQ